MKNILLRPSQLVVALQVKGQGSFAKCEDGQGSRRFTKDVVQVGQFRLPDGRLLEVLQTKVEAAARRAKGALAAGLDELAANTNEWIRSGQKVWFPEGDQETEPHNSVASLNRGYWNSFRVEGDRLVAVVEADDEDVAAKLGKTIRDVSVAIAWAARASDDRVFDVVVEHVCITSFPVVPRQGNFVPLARDVRMDAGDDGDGDDGAIDALYAENMAGLAKKDGYQNDDGTFRGGFDGCVAWAQNTKGLSDKRARALCATIGRDAGKIPAARQEGPPVKKLKLGRLPANASAKRVGQRATVTRLAQYAGLAVEDDAKEDDGSEPADADLSNNDAKKLLAVLVGLDADTSWTEIVSQARSMMIGQSVDKGEPGMMARLAHEAESKIRAELGGQLDAVKAQLARERKKAADVRVNAAKKSASDAGIPLEKDVEDRARALLSREDEESQKDGELLLGAFLKRSEDRSTPFARLAYPAPRKNEGEEGSELQDAMLSRRGYERTPEGEIVKKRAATA